jgi:hypothetical protein
VVRQLAFTNQTAEVIRAVAGHDGSTCERKELFVLSSETRLELIGGVLQCGCGLFCAEAAQLSGFAAERLR